MSDKEVDANAPAKLPKNIGEEYMNFDEENFTFLQEKLKRFRDPKYYGTRKYVEDLIIDDLGKFIEKFKLRLHYQPEAEHAMHCRRFVQSCLRHAKAKIEWHCLLKHNGVWLGAYPGGREKFLVRALAKLDISPGDRVGIVDMILNYRFLANLVRLLHVEHEFSFGSQKKEITEFTKDMECLPNYTDMRPLVTDVQLPTWKELGDRQSADDIRQKMDEMNNDQDLDVLYQAIMAILPGKK